MQKDTFILWANYNQVVNRKMNEIINNLSASEWDKTLGGYFKSIRGLCSHIYICDFNWLKFFSRLRNFKVLDDTFFTGKRYTNSEILFGEKSEYLAKRPELDEKMIAFVNELVYGDLNTFLEFTDSQGKAKKQLFGGLLMQCFNHDSHHRGMISLYLEMLGYKNNFSSLGVVL